jgi:hypothetical protein
LSRRRAYRGFEGNSGGRDHLEDLGVVGDNVKTNLQVVGWGAEERIDLDQGTGRW